MSQRVSLDRSVELAERRSAGGVPRGVQVGEAALDQGHFEVVDVGEVQVDRGGGDACPPRHPP